MKHILQHRSELMHCIVLSLPIRNWNTIFLPYHFALYSNVLSLPIRNWNIKEGKCCGHKDESFESTYKELKLDYNTYITEQTQSFESTYKELKQSIIDGFHQVFKVLSLPIRNWNTYTFPPFTLSPRNVLSLPIRNWNMDFAPSPFTLMVTFWVYL